VNEMDELRAFFTYTIGVLAPIEAVRREVEGIQDSRELE
jgi:hypothetical protein